MTQPQTRIQPQSPAELDFGDAAAVDASLSERVRGLVGSEILKIAAQIRARIQAGDTVCNLTVGDFDSKQFPIPRRLQDRLVSALERGETNYPPADGVLSLRRAVAAYAASTWGVTYPVESVLIAGGARPLLYAAYRSVLDPGDTVVYPVPSWNNNHYAWIAAAHAVEIPARATDGFMPRLADIEPHLENAQLLVLNTPLNPTGSVMEPETVRALTEAVVEENRRRAARGRRQLFLLHDQVYAALVFGKARHVHPVALVPEAAPWVLSLDAISKTFAATGLRVGWMLGPPAVVKRMANLLGHVGAWAPRAEQVAVGEFLDDRAAVQEFAATMQQRVFERLDAVYRGMEALRARGAPVDCIAPEGAIYLSVRFDVAGRVLDGKRLEDDEDIRRVLLEAAGIAVVPFQAFGLGGRTGWFRLSVGAVSVAEIEAALPRLATLLDRLS
jgi:aspartate aminotransferase